MKKNMGSADKGLRILVAIVIAILYFMNIITGTLGIILGLIAIVFILTSAMGFCPAYMPFGINTAKKEEK